MNEPLFGVGISTSGFCEYFETYHWDLQEKYPGRPFLTDLLHRLQPHLIGQFGGVRPIGDQSCHGNEILCHHPIPMLSPVNPLQKVYTRYAPFSR